VRKNLLLIRALFFNFTLLSTVFAQDIWVDATQGNDAHDGLSETTAIQTLQTATSRVTAGSTIRIKSGIYREQQLILPVSGTSDAPITYQADENTVFIYGSENAAQLTWNSLTTNEINLPASTNLSAIFWTDISTWQLTQAPRFIVQLDEQGAVKQRFHLAREPDWQVTTAWKQHEFWWAANGGQQIANCNPQAEDSPSHCDNNTRSATQLIDNNHDSLPANIEQGNLTTLGDLTGATLTAIDAAQGNYLYHRQIIQHDVTQGKITLDRPAYYPTFGKTDNMGLGWGSKYYVENHPALLDSPGEYWFDVKTQRLYFWLPEGIDLAQIEISRYDTAFDLSHRSHVNLTGINFSFFNQAAIQLNATTDLALGSQNLQFTHLNLNYLNQGITIKQTAFAHISDNVSKEITIQNSTFSEIDDKAIIIQSIWDNSETAFSQAAISNITIKNNELYQISKRSDTEIGAAITITFPDHLYFENNYLHDIAHNGLLLSQSMIQSDKTYYFTPDEIKTGQILLKNNFIENNCQLLGDCGAIKFEGQPPHHHVFRDTLITGNRLRHNYGWSYAAEQRRLWANGQFAFGLYGSYMSGIHVYRNLIYNNGLDGIFFVHHWRDGEIIITNNLLANQFNGIELWNRADQGNYPANNVKITNNILFNNKNYGITHTGNLEDTHFVLDYNLYFRNGWNDNVFDKNPINNSRAKAYGDLIEVQNQTPWEIYGLTADPLFINAEQADFHLTHCSAAIDRSTSLPTSLSNLLTLFTITEAPQTGKMGDIGAYEYEVPTMATATGLFTSTGEKIDTDAHFDIILTNAMAESVTTINPMESVTLNANLFPDSCDIGRAAEIVIVAAYQPQGSTQQLLFMRQGEQWQYWNGLNLNELMPAMTGTTLEQQINVTIYNGTFQNLLGKFTIYLGYRRVDGGLIFNGQMPLQFVVQE